MIDTIFEIAPKATMTIKPVMIATDSLVLNGYGSFHPWMIVLIPAIIIVAAIGSIINNTSTINIIFIKIMSFGQYGIEKLLSQLPLYKMFY